MRRVVLMYTCILQSPGQDSDNPALPRLVLQCGSMVSPDTITVRMTVVTYRCMKEADGIMKTAIDQDSTFAKEQVLMPQFQI